MDRLHVVATITAGLLAACTPVSATRDSAIDALVDATRDAPSVDILADAPDAPSSPDPLAASLAPPLDTDPAHYPAGVWTSSALTKLSTSAMPGTTHWVQLFAGRNEFESWYTGTVTVRDGATVLAQLPVRLGVWDFELNATASLSSTFEISWWTSRCRVESSTSTSPSTSTVRTATANPRASRSMHDVATPRDGGSTSSPMTVRVGAP
ncbi:MAG: hypothetical protein WCJ30_15750 [Deltaproteobacteria bacterium]